MIQQLIIDPEFRDLIPPLSAQELENLEESLLREGCREPIVIWNHKSDVLSSQSGCYFLDMSESAEQT